VPDSLGGKLGKLMSLSALASAIPRTVAAGACQDVVDRLLDGAGWLLQLQRVAQQHRDAQDRRQRVRGVVEGVDRVLQLVDESRRQTLIARRAGDVLHFDIRLQGEGETVFFGI